MIQESNSYVNLEMCEIVLKLDRNKYNIKIFELNFNDNSEYFITEANSILLVFDSEDIESLQNCGNVIRNLKHVNNYQGQIYLIGISVTGFKIPVNDELSSLLKNTEIEVKYYEISNFNKKDIEEVFSTIMSESSKIVKDKKVPDKSPDNVSCIVN
jgi:GTPase SAR1 family protein